jgi:hypothetical protein
MAAPVQDPARTDPEHPDRPERQGRPDRYESLPGLVGLPAWVWRRLPRPAKAAVAASPLVVVALILLLGPGIDRTKDERERAEAQRLEQISERRAARQREEQRPRRRRGTAAGADLSARAALVDEVAAAIAADARRRVSAGALEGPIRRVACEPYPRSVAQTGAHTDPARRFGRYACLAVTQDVPPAERTEAAAIGHPYRVRIDFESGRYGFCKVAGRPGEGSLGTTRAVAVPRACGGR